MTTRREKEYLPGIADGETIATLAFTEPDGEWDEAGITAAAGRDGDGCRLNGTKMFVLDGHTADLIIVAARTGCRASRCSPSTPTARGVTRTRCRRWTRPASRPSSSSPTRRPRSSAPRAGLARARRVLDLAAVGLAAEQVGGAQKVLEMAVEYAKVRVQFGRPIGSFQAIKHKCADMLLEVESAKSAAYYAACGASSMNDELPVGGVAGQGVLLDGLLPRRRREHPDPRRHRLHLGAPGAPVLQAGQGSELLFGDPTYHRELLAQRIGI